jgi:DNA-binding NarL/FixJ family response regulator
MMKTPTAETPKPIRKRVLLIEDHPLTREGLARWINSEPDLEVCGEAGSAPEAISLVDKLKHRDLPVLVLSMHDESAYAARALRAGARGYVMKSAGGDGVVNAIREVLRGHLAFSPETTMRLLGGFGKRQSASRRSDLPILTDREFEILQLLGGARSNGEIAGQLHLSIKTVQTHRTNLARKLRITSASALLRFAMQYAQEEVSGHCDS